MTKRKSPAKAGAAAHATATPHVSSAQQALSTPAAISAPHPISAPDAAKADTLKRKRQIVRPYRTTKFMQERSSLLRCLLRDARLQRCVQLVY